MRAWLGRLWGWRHSESMAGAGLYIHGTEHGFSIEHGFGTYDYTRHGEDLGGETVPTIQPRRTKMPPQVTQISGQSSGEFLEYETDDEGSGKSNGVKHTYRDETWTKDFFTYDPKPKEFLGRRGTSQFFELLPTIL